MATGLIMIILAFLNKILSFLFIFFVLWFNVPVNNFSAILGHSHTFLGTDQYFGKLMSLAYEYISAMTGFKPTTF